MQKSTCLKKTKRNGKEKNVIGFGCEKKWHVKGMWIVGKKCEHCCRIP